MKRGKRFNKSGPTQVYYCKKCGARFSPTATGTKGGVNAAIGLIALDLHFKGLSLRNISDHIWQVYGVSKPVSTLQFWVTKLNRLIIKACENLPVKSEERWLADEMFLKVRGNPLKYVWSIMGYESRQIVASLVLDKRGTEEAAEVIAAAIKKAGKAPKTLVSDGLKSYRNALSTRFAGSGIEHVENVALADKQKNNNRIERFNGTLRSWTRTKRGIKNPEKVAGFVAYYNNLRAHMSNGETPPGSDEKVRLGTLLNARTKKNR